MTHFSRGFNLIILVSAISRCTICYPEERGPTLNFPERIRALENRTELDSSEVLSVVRNSDCCAYPLRIMSYHMVVNDRLGGSPVLVVYDPVSAAGLAFDPLIGGKCYHFDVSSSTLHNIRTLKDRETGSHWSILTGACERGPLKGKRMYRIPSWISSWRLWRRLHPETWLLKELPGQSSRYVVGPSLENMPHTSPKPQESPYLLDPRLPGDTMVLGVAGEGDSEVFTMDLLNYQSGVINFRLNSRRLILFHDSSEHASGVYIPEINGRLLTFSIVTNAQTTQCIDTQFSDDQTHSLWSFDGRAISGTLKDAVLTPAVFIRCRWQAWNKSFLPSQIYGQNRKRIGQL